MTARARIAVLAAVCAALSACTTVEGRGSVVSPSAGTTASTPAPTSTGPGPSQSSSPAAAGCPSSYAQPDPKRPRVALKFTVADDMATVTGAERITFTPDLPITELVFRLTPNTEPSVQKGNQITVTSATADHGAGRYRFSSAAAAPGTQGGLLHIPFPTTVNAGTTVTAELAFTVKLGAESFDRFGRISYGNAQYAWFASAHPLLAWERGYGWHKEDLIEFTAESATSEAMDTDLTVVAPARATVIMSGNPGDPAPGGATRTWHATLDAARDVSVAVGPFNVSDTTVGSVRLRVGAYDPRMTSELVPEFQRAITELAKLFGPYPFPSLAVARVPAQGGGIEYPAAILMLDGSRVVAVHETAHQWFYAMVGDSQSLHPWLDEAFASYAEQLVDGNPDTEISLQVPGAVDRSVESYGSDMDSYYFITYSKGAAALHAAREAAGSRAWDAAVRCYVNANAWRIANPDDFAAAIKKFPAAVSVLKKAGALR